MGKNKYVGHRYVPKLDGEWDNSKSYESLTIVQHQGASYTSRQNVPVGVEITNDEFWVVTGNYNEQVESYRQEVRNLESDVKPQLAKNVTQDLKSNIIDTSFLNVSGGQSKRPLVTFIDDDGAESVYTRLKPIFESKGVPCTVAIVSDWVGKENVGNQGNLKAMSREQILELQDMGWEIASHEKTHQGMTNVTDKNTIESEIINSKEELLKMGLKVTNLVYPFGQSNDELVNIAKNYYKSGVSTGVAGNNEINNVPIDRFNLRRVGLGSYAGQFDTLTHHKSVVDSAIENGGWLIFMTHVWAQDTSKDELIADVLDYIISKGVDIVTLEEGLSTFGDKVDIDGLLRVTPDNQILSNVVVPFLKLPINSITADTPISSFSSGAITSTQIGAGNTAGFPDNSAGVVITDRTYPNGGYQRQTFYKYNSFQKFERYWTIQGAWSAFIKEKQSIDLESTNTIGKIDAHTALKIEIPVDGATTPDQVVVSADLVDGLIYSARVKSLGVVEIKIYNSKPTPVNGNNGLFRISVLKNR